MRRAARVTCKGRDPKTGYPLLLSLFCFIFRLSSCFGFPSDFWQWLPFPWCISPWLHQTVPFFLFLSFSCSFIPFISATKARERQLKKREISRKPGCKNCKLFKMCMHTHIYTHTHTHTVTVLYLKGAQHVTRGGINYLNLSDLPSLFWHLYLFPPILLSVLFLFLCPPVSTHRFISTSAIFFF